MIYVDATNKTIPLYKQLYESLKKEIISGALPFNSTITPIRKMAEELKVSRNTVDHAYGQLVAEGYLRTIRGGGYFVDYVPEGFSSEPVKFTVPKKSDEVALKYNFKYESLESSTFPWAKWRKYIQNALLEEECSSDISYESNKGNYFLRSNLALYLRNSRGVNCTPEQMVICAGTQFGIHTIITCLPEKKYRLGFEEPGYDGMKKSFSNSGMEIELIPVIDDGLDLDVIKEKKCNIIYMTPSHQFPTGIVTSLAKRLEILEWAEETDSYIIENDYDNEFNHSEKKLPSLQSLDRNGRVIYVGMMTKVLSPSIRCAYVVFPEKLLKRYEEKFSFFNTALPNYHQIALAHFIEDGMLESHVRKMARINRRKYRLIIDIFYNDPLKMVSLYRYPAGTHTLIKIPRCDDQEELIAFMKSHSIGLCGTKMYWHDKEKAPENVFLLGFNAMNESDLGKACTEFLRVLEMYFKSKNTES